MSFSGTKIKYRGIDKDSTIVWKPKHYDVDKFDFDKVKARIEKCKEEGDKKALEVITKNIKRVCKDNPDVFDDFLSLVE
jgi:hypothetical protein